MKHVDILNSDREYSLDCTEHTGVKNESDVGEYFQKPTCVGEITTRERSDLGADSLKPPPASHLSVRQ